MKVFKNKSGFTLVELLAVIVILALIMGIAAYSMQGVTENVRISSMKSSALALVDGVRNELLSNMNLEAGYYYIGENLLDKKTESPWGGEYNFSGSTSARTTKASETLSCSSNGGSFVRIEEAADKRLSYTICLHDNLGHYIYANETILLKKDPEKTEYHVEKSGDNVTVYVDADGKISETDPNKTDN